MTGNQIKYAEVVEKRRSNLVNEELTRKRDSEAARHNAAMEDVQYSSLGETKRSNLAKESETNRSNLAKEYESHRHNVVSEGISSQQINLGYANVGLGYANLDELNRSNMMRESYNLAHLDEQVRTNTANEDIRMRSIAETIRSNQAREDETHRSNLAKELETNRSNVARETETNRSNVAQESLKQQSINETERSNTVNEGIQKGNLFTRAFEVGAKYSDSIGNLIDSIIPF